MLRSEFEKDQLLEKLGVLTQRMRQLYRELAEREDELSRAELAADAL